jgi:hypothetical protein
MVERALFLIMTTHHPTRPHNKSSIIHRYSLFAIAIAIAIAIHIYTRNQPTPKPTPNLTNSFKSIPNTLRKIW